MGGVDEAVEEAVARAAGRRPGAAQHEALGAGAAVGQRMVAMQATRIHTARAADQLSILLPCRICIDGNSGDTKCYRIWGRLRRRLPAIDGHGKSLCSWGQPAMLYIQRICNIYIYIYNI